MSEFWIALIGAVVGGGFALGGVALTDWYDRTRARENQRSIVRRFLLALVDEIETVWKSYQEDIGGTIEALGEGQPFEFHYPIYSELLPIYHRNISVVLEIEDRELRKSIVVTCTSYVTLMDCIRFNNVALEDLEKAEAAARQAGGSDAALAEEVRRCRDQVVEYAKTIRVTHDGVARDIAQLKGLVERALGEK